MSRAQNQTKKIGAYFALIATIHKNIFLKRFKCFFIA